MTRLLLRGRVLRFLREPEDGEDAAAYRYHSDGAVLIAGGHIEAVGEHADLAPRAAGAATVDHRPHLITAGFIDAHIHFPQVQVIASWGAQLIDWLNTYTFPAEIAFGDPAHAERMARCFLDALIRHGTTTAAAFCSVHPASAEALFAAAERRNMRMIGGKVLMDRNAPDGLRDTAQSGHDETEALIARWHGRGRALYAITPRFAITSTPAQLEAAGALAAAHPDCYIQTHLSENEAEIRLTAELHPEARDYLDVYERHGLIGPRTLLAHAIHLGARERAAIASAGARPVFCPTSNLFLGSGLFDAAALRAAGATCAIATDVGAGTSYSMLATLAEGYKVLQLRGQSLHPLRALYWITRGNAEALGLADRIGTLAPGSEADLVVLDAAATPEMALRMETVGTLAEEIFVLQMMGDDRAVAETYIAGIPQKTPLAG
jgi:guanine deaminase